MAVCWVGVPVALVTLAEIVRPVYVDRYLLPAAVGLAVLAALGVTGLPTRWMPIALAGLLVASAGATVSNLSQGPREDVRGAVAWVAHHHHRGEPVVAAARWDALGVDHYARRLHPELTHDLVLPPAGVPDAPVVWVVRRATVGVKGDTSKLADLDRALVAGGLGVTEERSFPGRRAVVLVQRWASTA